MRAADAHQPIVLERHELGVLSEATNAAQSDTATATAAATATATANADTNDATTTASYAANAASSTAAAAATAMLHTAGMILQQSLLQPQQSAHQIRTQLVHAQLAPLPAGAGRR